MDKSPKKKCWTVSNSVNSKSEKKMLIFCKIFCCQRGKAENPSPGTVVDSVVTRRNYYDFFLVPQTSRQGTVSPTHYIVIYDGAEMKPDHVQRLSFKLCHLYYNWPGTVRVPAPCQYAHKLAYLVGQSIGMQPSESLANSLYYLWFFKFRRKNLFPTWKTRTRRLCIVFFLQHFFTSHWATISLMSLHLRNSRPLKRRGFFYHY